MISECRERPASGAGRGARGNEGATPCAGRKAERAGPGVAGPSPFLVRKSLAYRHCRGAGVASESSPVARHVSGVPMRSVLLLALVALVSCQRTDSPATSADKPQAPAELRPAPAPAEPDPL